MKKLIYLFAAAVVIAIPGCQKPEANPDNQEEKNQEGTKPDDGQKDDFSIPTDQYIEETIKALLGALDYSNWQKEAEFVQKVVQTIQQKEYDTEILEKWADALTESWQKEPYQEGNSVIYTSIVRLSDAKGHFTEQPDGSFAFTDADDFQITIQVDGESVTASFICTDSTVPIRISKSSRQGYNYETGAEEYTYNYDYLYVPTSATLKILRGSSEFASLVLNAAVDVKDPDELSLLTDSASIGATLKLGVYTLAVQKLEYTPTAAQVKVKLLSGSESLISIDATADNYTIDESSNLPLPVKGGIVNAAVDVMGMIQVKANIPDLSNFFERGMATDDFQQADEQQFKAAVEAFEGTFSAGMYFNGSDTPRATLGMEAARQTPGPWYVNPVLRFHDGTAMGFEEYFSEQRFGNLIIYIMSWAGDIGEKLNKISGSANRIK